MVHIFSLQAENGVFYFGYLFKLGGDILRIDWRNAFMYLHDVFDQFFHTHFGFWLTTAIIFLLIIVLCG